MKTKTVARVISPGTPHFVGDGFRVHNYIPGNSSMQEMDPFIMLDYNSKYHFGPSEIPRGVGVHPHKGFETVTIAYQGKVEHGDSTGSGGVIHEGDVQWMTAASGILHKEFHEKEWSKKGGIFQMVQLWVNLPAKYKNDPPGYQNITNHSIPKIQLPNDAGVIEIIAGEYAGVTGAAKTFTPIHLLNAKIKSGESINFNFPAGYTTALLVIEGNIQINDIEKVAEDSFALFERDGEKFTVKASEDAVVLILSGEPIREPIAAHGPFVMNTRQELVEAFDDFNNGKFGHLD